MKKQWQLGANDEIPLKDDLDAKLDKSDAVNGYTKWEITSNNLPDGCSFVGVAWYPSMGWIADVADARDPPMTVAHAVECAGPIDAVSLDLQFEGTASVLSRAKLRPTRTSELINDGADGIPFATEEEPEDTIVTYSDGTKTALRLMPTLTSGSIPNLADATTVKIGRLVQMIGPQAFQGASSLTSVTIPSSVRFIVDRAFHSCANLTSVSFADGVQSLGNLMFFGCTSLVDVKLPESLKIIGDSAFNSCSSLTEMTIPPNVVGIGAYAFMNCSGLVRVTIPQSVTSIGGFVFSGCTALENVTFEGRTMSDVQAIPDSSGTNRYPWNANTSVITTMTVATREWVASEGFVKGSGGVSTISVVTQAAYDALATKDPNTVYIIPEA